MRFCEDYPACGHEMGDCDGSLYGSDESIKARVHANDPSVYERGTPEWYDAMEEQERFEEDEE
jgi:hypothetical protein